MTKLNEQTTIPLWSILVAVPSIVGAIFWISFVAYKTNTNAEVIQDLKVTQAEMQKNQLELKDTTLRLMFDIKTDLAVIKSKLNINERK